jgi:hypothetical protein
VRGLPPQGFQRGGVRRAREDTRPARADQCGRIVHWES